MDGIEQAIRRALAKGEADDPSFRERVYRSAFAALDKSLKDKPELTVENAIKRRKALQATIANIETEYQPAAEPEHQLLASEPQPFVEPDEFAEYEGFTAAPAIDVGSDERFHGEERIHPALNEVQPRLSKRRATRAPRESRKRNWLRTLIVLGIVALVLVVGGIWAFNALRGLDPSSIAQQLNTTLADRTDDGGPPPLSANGADDPEAGWTTVFDPEDIQLVDVPGDASVEALEDDGAAFIRARSGASNAPIRIAVGEGLLERFAGQQVVFNLVARGIDGEASQIAVECDFAALGECGRTRYDVGATAEDFLFEVPLPDQAPGRGGAISIVTDVEGQGRGVEILGIRLRAAE